jgi:exopolysaccharide biosynthesis operon protein EpsL
MQAFKIDYAYVLTRYNNAKLLNFDASNYNAAWLWSVTPSLKGNLSASRKVQALNYRDLRVTDSKNIRTTQVQTFDFDWSPHNNWHLLGGYTMMDSINSQTFLPETSFKLNMIDSGIMYSFPSASNVALKLRHSSAKNQTSNFASFIGNGYVENEGTLNALWILTGKSRVSSFFGYDIHTDKTFSLRDYSGYFGDINYAWDISSKSKLTIDLSRKLSPFQTDYSSYNVLDTLSINPAWSVTSKVVIGLNGQISKRDYRGNGPITTLKRVDNSLSYGMTVDWAPRSTILLGIDAQYSDRSTNAVNADYSGFIAGINGKIAF